MNNTDKLSEVALEEATFASSLWRAAIPAALLSLVFTLWLYRDTASAMVTIWYRSETFTHAFVVPPIAGWLIWRRRHELATLTPRPAFAVLVFLAGAALGWLLGDLAAVNAVTQLCLTAMLVLVVPALLGLQVAHAILFPLAFLFFAVPIGEFLLPQLMEWTAYFTIVALRMSGIPVYQEGLQFVIPSGNWSVVEACSGVRYLIASLTVGTLFAYLNYHSTKRRVLFVIVSILVPIVANWMRAYMIVMLGHLSGNKIAVGVDHLLYGWVFFGIVIMLMFIVGARWSEPEPLPGAAVLSPRASAGAASVSRLWTAAACVAAIVSLPALGEWAIERQRSSAVPMLAVPAVLAGGWQAANAATMGFKPDFKNASAETNGVYANSGKTVGLYLGYYQDQDYEHKLVSSENVLVSSADPRWIRAGGGTLATSFADRQASVRTAELRRLPLSGSDQQGRLVAWQIYWIDGTLTSSDYLAKVYSAVYRLIGRGDHSAVIILYTAKGQSGDADATLAGFLSANYGAIDALLRRAKDGN